MPILLLLCIIATSTTTHLLATESRPYRAPHHAGLRWAQQLSPTQLRACVGPGLAVGSLGKLGSQSFQVASQSDADFHKRVNASSVRLISEQEDATYPDGYDGPRFKQAIIEVTLDRAHALKAGNEYWLIVANPWLIAKNKAASIIRDKIPDTDYAANYGIREITPVAADTIHLQCGAGLDIDHYSEVDTISVTDDNGERLEVSTIYRKSGLDFYTPAGWPWPRHQQHDLYIRLKQPMQQGVGYRVDINAKKTQPLTCGRSQATLMFDDRQSINYAIKNNHYGYRPDAANKYAYVGLWMGDGNAYDFAPYMNSFEVRDAVSHKVILTGKPSLRQKAVYRLQGGNTTPDPNEIKGPETVYKQDLTYEDVYQLDLSELRKPGSYYIAVPNLGRGFTFRIDDGVYREAFDIVMNGIYHQRCGHELSPPHAVAYRPACHRHATQLTDLPRGPGGAGNPDLEKHVIDDTKHDIYGGHHDAGDWEPRAHIEIAEILFLLYDIKPKTFADGQLRMSENDNGIPDILDEASWALDLWTRLQAEDGGVHYGTESTRDPLDTDRAHTDTLGSYAFAKDAKSSYLYAAVSAQAATIWKGLGRNKIATGHLKRALKAFDWAQKNDNGQNADHIAYASAALFRATGERIYDDLFRAHCILTHKPDAVPDEYNKHDQILAFYHYVRAKGGDTKLKQAIIASFEADFRNHARWAATTAYRYLRSPYSPNTWGTGAMPIWLIKPAICMTLTKNPDIRQECSSWIQYTNDFSLGGHPMGMCFTVGLGQRYVTTAWHHLQKYSPVAMIPGLQSEGPGGNFVSGPGNPKGGMGGWTGLAMYPPGIWPDLYKYAENVSPGMNEGIVVNQVKTAFAYGMMLP